MNKLSYALCYIIFVLGAMTFGYYFIIRDKGMAMILMVAMAILRAMQVLIETKFKNKTGKKQKALTEKMVETKELQEQPEIVEPKIVKPEKKSFFGGILSNIIMVVLSLIYYHTQSNVMLGFIICYLFFYILILGFDARKANEKAVFFAFLLGLTQAIVLLTMLVVKTYI